MAQRIHQDLYQPDIRLENGWSRRQLDPALGHCYTDRLLLEPGLSIAYSHYAPKTDVVESSVMEQDNTTFSLTFGLSGKSCYRPKQLHRDEFVFETKYTTVTTFGHSVGERCYQAGSVVNQLRIIVDGSLFERYQMPFPSAARNLKSPQKHRHAITTSSSDYLVQRLTLLAQSNRSERPLEKHILVMNLLSEQLMQLTHQEDSATSAHRGIDEAKLLNAKAFMLQNMEQPLSLAYIATQVGLSESKLQTGFKTYFNQSPYRFLLEARMLKAWELLQSGYQVTQAAYAVGYEHPSNFSAAFRQFFGQTPKSVGSHPNH